MCDTSNKISTYSIISGLAVYASLYLYILFYKNDYLGIFNKFIIYIITADLLISTMYHIMVVKKADNEDKNDDLNITKLENDIIDIENKLLVAKEADHSSCSSEEDDDQDDLEDQEDTITSSISDVASDTNTDVHTETIQLPEQEVKNFPIEDENIIVFKTINPSVQLSNEEMLELLLNEPSNHNFAPMPAAKLEEILPHSEQEEEPLQEEERSYQDQSISEPVVEKIEQPVPLKRTTRRRKTII
jgi:hypothetical protein